MLCCYPHQPTPRTLNQMDHRNQVKRLHCGSVVSGTVTLRENMNCTDDGLIIGEDATTLNLNGFSIQGPGKDSSNAGISVTKDNIKIVGPGVVSGFETGILVTGGGEISVKSVILQNNQI